MTGASVTASRSSQHCSGCVNSSVMGAISSCRRSPESTVPVRKKPGRQLIRMFRVGGKGEKRFGGGAEDYAVKDLFC